MIDDDTVVSGGGGARVATFKVAVAAMPPPRTLRSADLPGASYFAPQGRRHISHEARSRIILLWSCTPSSRTRLARACRLENSRAIGPTVISRRHPRLGRDDDTAGRYIAPCVS